MYKINLLFTKVTKKELTKKGIQSKKESVVTELVTMELATFEVFLEAYKYYNQDMQKIIHLSEKLENGIHIP